MTVYLLTPFMLPLTAEKLIKLHLDIYELLSDNLAYIFGYLWDMIIQQSDISIISYVSITVDAASHTGNTYHIIEYLYNILTSAIFIVKLVNVCSYKFKTIIQEKFFLLVVSTQRKNNLLKEIIDFYEYSFSNKVPQLTDIAFVIFSLSTGIFYEKFFQTGIDLDAKLGVLGDERLLKYEGNNVNFKNIRQVWTRNIIEILKKRFSQANTINKLLDSVCRNFVQNTTMRYSKEHPLTATLLLNQKITGHYSNKNIHHIEIDLGESGLCYQPGDALGVWYHNDLELVKEILGLLLHTGNEIVTIQGKNITLHKALSDHFELMQNNTIIVEKYAKLSNDKHLITLLSNKKNLLEYTKRTPFPDMIRQAPTNLSVEQLLSLLLPLTPRFYSISSSQAKVGKEVHITVGVVKYNINGHTRTGGASGYLSTRLKENSKLRIFIQYNNNFRLPSNPQAPIIMIGPGTGVAPFRSFIQQRAAEGATGLNWLFFGNPHFTEDYLYQMEWQYYIKKGILSRIDLAWSQDQVYKIYVQDKMRKQGGELWHWIKNGAYIYVCGDANRMAKEVEYTLLEILVKHGGMNIKQSNKFLNELRINRRYQQDVY
ncbi:NADPH-dependent assimilatory sulfite reductase flavoprotein subunit [Candidatus Profftia sp. (ex Adelges kitamiensis)]|uniref:NADPH-dependent assimilatory sulfite reductase flavoprotein subunit n=1 Tax=Candidatus Profftia sp. (ex Adelges kitamiensis) TaxID=2864218 RepID=UPI001CE237D6|nr:NADPH-dependent assimilatory sulfite reductase flavoprotein subunit [Candidatus Profftia sp. (ex Adelges kitamiensis)]